jgi:hypothetical protein
MMALQRAGFSWRRKCEVPGTIDIPSIETAQEHQAPSPRRQRSGTPGASSIVWHASLPRQRLLAPSGRKRTGAFKGPLSSVDSSTGPGRQAVQVPPVRDEDLPPRPGSFTRLRSGRAVYVFDDALTRPRKGDSRGTSSRPGPGRDRGAIGEALAIRVAVCSGYMIAHDSRLSDTFVLVNPRAATGIDPVIGARASGIPPAEASRDDR